VETTEVDLRNGRMETRMRNLDHKKVLYVEERGTWSKMGDKYDSKLRWLTIGHKYIIRLLYPRHYQVYCRHGWRSFRYGNMMRMARNKEWAC
jgi:hypothetical protein